VRNWLIVYDRSDGELVECAEFTDSQAALAARFERERWFTGFGQVEIVVLGADSLETIKRTHSRYFAGKVPGEQPVSAP
jgi:hypothetical protein